MAKLHLNHNTEILLFLKTNMGLLNFQSFVIMFKLNKEGWRVESNTNREDQHKVDDSDIMPLVFFSMH